MAAIFEMDISQINYRRTVVQCEEIISAVNQVLPEHYLAVAEQLDFLTLPLNSLISPNVSCFGFTDVIRQ